MFSLQKQYNDLIKPHDAIYSWICKPFTQRKTFLKKLFSLGSAWACKNIAEKCSKDT